MTMAFCCMFFIYELKISKRIKDAYSYVSKPVSYFLERSSYVECRV